MRKFFNFLRRLFSDRGCVDMRTHTAKHATRKSAFQEELVSANAANFGQTDGVSVSASSCMVMSCCYPGDEE